jgi:uncharacterized membrane protein
MGLFRLITYMGQQGAINTFLKLLFSSEVVVLSSVQGVIGYFSS